MGELLCIAELMQLEGTSNNREKEEANSGKELEMMCSERVEEWMPQVIPENLMEGKDNFQ